MALPLAAAVPVAENSRQGFATKKSGSHPSWSEINFKTVPGIGVTLRPEGIRSRCQSLNRYAYVVKNPTTLIDPSGLSNINPAQTCGHGFVVPQGQNPAVWCYNHEGIGEGSSPGAFFTNPWGPAGGIVELTYNIPQSVGSESDLYGGEDVDVFYFIPPSLLTGGSMGAGGNGPSGPVVARPPQAQQPSKTTLFTDCVKGVEAQTLSQNTANFETNLKRSVVGGVALGVGACGVIVASEPYLAPGFPGCAVSASVSSVAIGAGLSLTNYVISNVASTAGSVYYCGRNEFDF